MSETERIIAGCRCVVCFSSELICSNDAASGVVCAACGTDYDVLHDIPHLLSLEQKDFVSLVEIAGEFDRPEYDLNEAKPHDETWPRLLAEFDSCIDREAFVAKLSAGERITLSNRYEEWSEIATASAGLDLNGKHVLVLGAGLGFDVNLHLYKGASVTACDLNPQTNALGKRFTPRARWIGALGRNLPFPDESFDHVFINAALHHVIDVAATISEMLRVVKVGGSVVTTSDSFTNDALTDKEEARFWNDHPAVLRGINENRHRLKSYIDVILSQGDAIDAHFWTSRVYGLWDEESETYVNKLFPTKWDLKTQHERLRKSSGGGIFMRLTKTKRIELVTERSGPGILRPRQLLSWVGRKKEAMAALARLAPAEYVSPRFPGPAGNTKFAVLNGWRWTASGEKGREAFLCGRWIFTRSEKADRLLAAVVAPAIEQAPDAVLFEVIVDGDSCASVPARRGERVKLDLDISAAPTKVPFAVEIRMEGEADQIDKGLFRVLELQLKERRSFNLWGANSRDRRQV